MKGEFFYPLTPEITNKLRKAKLTAAEWRIWSYLIERDPWGDRYIDIETLDVMSQCDCSKATFYRAIGKFQKLGLFDFQDKGFSYKNETGASRLRKGYRKNETEFSKMRQVSQICDSSLKNETEFSKMRQVSQICENQPLEPLPEEGSSSPQTLQTYSDFKQTLSEDEREKFLNFVEEQIQNLPTPVNDVEAWLAHSNKAGQNRWEVYYEKFKAAPTTSELKTYKGLTSRDIQEQAQQFREELKQMKKGTKKDSPPERDDSQESPERTTKVDESNSPTASSKEAIISQETPPEEKPKNVPTASDLDRVIAEYERNGRGQLPKIKPLNNPFRRRQR